MKITDKCPKCGGKLVTTTCDCYYGSIFAFSDTNGQPLSADCPKCIGKGRSDWASRLRCVKCGSRYDMD